MRIGQQAPLFCGAASSASVHSQGATGVALSGITTDQFQIRFGGATNEDVRNHQDWLAGLLNVQEPNWAGLPVNKRDFVLELVLTQAYREAQAEALGLSPDSSPDVYEIPIPVLAQQLGLETKGLSEEQLEERTYETLAEKTLEQFLNNLKVKDSAEAAKAREYFTELYS